LVVEAAFDQMLFPRLRATRPAPGGLAGFGAAPAAFEADGAGVDCVQSQTGVVAGLVPAIPNVKV